MMGNVYNFSPFGNHQGHLSIFQRNQSGTFRVPCNENPYSIVGCVLKLETVKNVILLRKSGLFCSSR